MRAHDDAGPGDERPPTALAIRHVRFEDLGLLEPVLRERGYAVEYADVGSGEFDARAVADADLVVVLGGPIGVYEADEHPVLRAEIAAIAERLGRGAPTLGICLGAQLLAVAAGAEVRATGAHEIGYAPLQLSAAGFASPLGHLAGVPVLHWHGDAFDLPAGVPSLAATPGFPNQAFALGDSALALQFHLEADPARIDEWLIGHTHELRAVGADVRGIRADAARLGAELASAGAAVVTEWLDRMPHPDAAAAGSGAGAAGADPSGQ
ncbi:glutamine amidotransferase [Agromyces mediolanus]|uniref:glutamine amidotransferase n=1 Tax=Agromyces mediolanus TaxID=41986 RepID=UPI001E431FC1|nr:glutamine amidotransferase [Agromyces mediolanus]MCD1572729.1 glutamine amidotransferase [Agromyces mediolanus]